MDIDKIRVMLDALKEGRTDRGTLIALAETIEQLMARSCGDFGKVEEWTRVAAEPDACTRCLGVGVGPLHNGICRYCIKEMHDEGLTPG